MPRQTSTELSEKDTATNLASVRERHGEAPAVMRDSGSHGPAGELERTSADDWSEESCRQTGEISRAAQAAVGPSLFLEFRRKLASGEALSRALARLAVALRFSGRITISFHQGRVTKTACEEMYLPGASRCSTGAGVDDS